MKKIITIIVFIAFVSCNTSKNIETGKTSKNISDIFANTRKVECSKDFDKRIGNSFINK